jgi:hypothetical protein
MAMHAFIFSFENNKKYNLKKTPHFYFFINFCHFVLLPRGN